MVGIGWSEIKKEKKKKTTKKRGERMEEETKRERLVEEKTYSFPCNVSSFKQVERNIWRQKKI